MPGIFPETGSGGVVVRDGAGVCQNPANVANDYCPPATFATTCPVTALPSDCTARLSAAQVNAIVSELLCFAATINPNGGWNCDDVCNLASNFEAWVAEHLTFDGDTIIGSGTAADPYRIEPIAVVAAICLSDVAGDSLAACLRSAEIGNLLAAGSDGRTTLTADQIAAGICADDSAGDALANCLVSPTTGNQLVLDPLNGRLFVPRAQQTPSAVNVTATAAQAIPASTETTITNLSAVSNDLANSTVGGTSIVIGAQDAGWWTIEAQAAYAFPTGDQRSTVSIKRNGTEIATGTAVGSSNLRARPAVGTTVKLVTGDVITFTTTTTLATSLVANESHFSMVKHGT